MLKVLDIVQLLCSNQWFFDHGQYLESLKTLKQCTYNAIGMVYFQYRYCFVGSFCLCFAVLLIMYLANSIRCLLLNMINMNMINIFPKYGQIKLGVSSVLDGNEQVFSFSTFSATSLHKSHLQSSALACLSRRLEGQHRLQRWFDFAQSDTPTGKYIGKKQKQGSTCSFCLLSYTYVV